MIADTSTHGAFMLNTCRWIASTLRRLASSTPSRQTTRRRPTTRLMLERLEDRTVPAVYKVTDIADTGGLPTTGGDGSAGNPFLIAALRSAIQQANLTAEADTITFQAGLNLAPVSSQMTITQPLTITGNGAASTIIDAGGNSRIFDVTAGDVTLDSLTLRNGKTTASADRGGAILFESNGTLAIRNSTLSGNSTTGPNISMGGAIFSFSGVVNVSNSTLSGNSTTGSSSSGGAIFVGNGTVQVSNSTLSGNFTTGNQSGGGAIATGTGGTMTVSNSTLSSNSTAGHQSYGGAISSDNGAVTVSNSTLSGNFTTGSVSFGHGGGAIYTNSGAVTVSNSTVVSNQATNIAGGVAGGGIFSVSGPVTVNNSIVAKNTDNGIAPDLKTGGALTVSHSLIGNNTGSGLAAAAPDGNGNFIGTNASPIDPLLGPLANNGGPTQTHALLLGSPAINGGSNALALDPSNAPLTTDQRGFARIDGAAVDMGAFEAHLNQPPKNTVPGKQTLLRNTSLTFLGRKRLKVADPDAGAALLRVTLTVTLGTLQLASTKGLTRVTHNKRPKIVLTGTIAAINNALNKLRFTPATNKIGKAKLTIATNDLGNSGLGGPLTDTDVVLLKIR